MRGLVIKVWVSIREATVDGEHPRNSNSGKLSSLSGLKEEREPFLVLSHICTWQRRAT